MTIFLEIMIDDLMRFRCDVSAIATFLIEGRGEITKEPLRLVMLMCGTGGFFLLRYHSISHCDTHLLRLLKAIAPLKELKYKYKKKHLQNNPKRTEAPFTPGKIYFDLP